MGAQNYAEWAFDVLKMDSKYSPYLDQLITPSNDAARRKAEVSSAVGSVVGHVLGVGWKTSYLTSAGISFKEQSPIWMMTFKDHKEPNKTKICFYFPVSGYMVDRDFRKMEIKPRKEGMISRRIVGVKFNLECFGKENMENDPELGDELLRLFTTQRLCDISDWTQSPITAEIEKKGNGALGKIEVGIESLNNEGLKTLFDAASRMATIMTSTIKSRGRPPQETLASQAQPAPPPMEEAPYISKIDESISWSSTWGKLCDLFIRKEGRQTFEKEYSTEMNKAYGKGILHVVPSLFDSLDLACKDQRQVLSFVDTTSYWALGYLVSQGPLRTSQETRIGVKEFTKQFVPPSIKDTPTTWPPSAKSDEKEPVLSKEGAPSFMVQSRLADLSYKIFECANEDRAKQTMKLNTEIIGQMFAPSGRLAETMVKMLPSIRKEYLEQATGTINVEEENVLVSRRVMPRVYLNVQGPDENKGGFALDYLMMWQHRSLLFSVYEPNVIRIWKGQTRMAYDKNENVEYDAQVLRNSLTTFQSNQLFEKGLTMLKNFAENKQFLLHGSN